MVFGQARALRRLAGASGSDGARVAVGTPALLEELHQRKQALKQAASSPVSIEVNITRPDSVP